MNKIRKIHKYLGLLLLLPLFGWVFTGFIFFIKPGYGPAYEMLSPKKYPMEAQIFSFENKPKEEEWLECRLFRTILGKHLLVRTSQGWQHLAPETLAVKKFPSKEELRRFIMDAISSSPERYGKVVEIERNRILTSTEVQITIDWTHCSLMQRGPDTEWIDWFYRIHYLQWTGNSKLDSILGVVGLIGIFLLSVLGLYLAFPKRKKRVSLSDEKKG